MRLRLLIPFLSAAVLNGCAGRQSALDVAGTDADALAHLFNVMMIGAAVVWVGVMAAAFYAIRVKPGTERKHATHVLIIGGGVVFPTIVLGALLVWGLPVLPQVLALAPEGALRIHVSGEQWWWRIHYETPEGFIETANELRLPVGRRVELQLSSPDVIHSFWVPSIAGKMDMVPGRITRLALEPTRTGVFRGACAEYCGASHALMAFDVIVSEVADFERWLSDLAAPAASPGDAVATRGHDVFLANGCGACHTIRGTGAAGRIGPDLTHVAQRLSIGAATLPNRAAALDRWIRDTDRVKPGVHMPAFRTLSTDDMTALTMYLDTLE